MSESLAPISVVTAFYKSEQEARHVLRALRALGEHGRVQILDAAVIVSDKKSSGLRMAGGETHAAQGERRRAAGGIIDRIFPPSILHVKPIGRAARAAEDHFVEQGFDRNLLREIGENLTPKGAALVAVIEETWLKEMNKAIHESATLTRYGIDADASGRLGTSVAARRGKHGAC